MTEHEKEIDGHELEALSDAIVRTIKPWQELIHAEFRRLNHILRVGRQRIQSDPFRRDLCALWFPKSDKEQIEALRRLRRGFPNDPVYTARRKALWDVLEINLKEEARQRGLPLSETSQLLDEEALLLALTNRKTIGRLTPGAPNEEFIKLARPDLSKEYTDGLLGQGHDRAAGGKTWTLVGPIDDAPHLASGIDSEEEMHTRLDMDLMVGRAGLSEAEREVIASVYWRDKTESQIAQRLGKKRGAIAQTKRRALKKLEKYLSNISPDFPEPYGSGPDHPVGG